MKLLINAETEQIFHDCKFNLVFYFLAVVDLEYLFEKKFEEVDFELEVNPFKKDFHETLPSIPVLRPILKQIIHFSLVLSDIDTELSRNRIVKEKSYALTL